LTSFNFSTQKFGLKSNYLDSINNTPLPLIPIKYKILSMSKVKKLNPNLIDQIAAGEVVERPASVVKELMENAIDAGADKIEVTIKSGGKKEIQISDNGQGMLPDDLEIAVESHTTSKIEEIDDISKIRTLGFRGEALSSIASVSKMHICSLAEGASKAYEIKVNGGKRHDPEVTSRNRGTTVTIKDLFYNVPARSKFLKTDKTEYRKVLNVFIPIALANPQIHFVLGSDGREVYNLPRVNDVTPGTIHPQRLSEVFKDTEFVELFYDGESITVGGVVAHPKHHKTRTKKRYIFVNGRPVWDNGVAKAVSVGANRFVPHNEKLPFAISINIKPEYVDVNVHPQKSEVRFANPYRVFSAVEKSVKAAFENDLGKDASDLEFERFRKEGVRSGVTHSKAKDISNHKVYNSDQSLKFSKMILEDSAGAKYKSKDDKDLSDSQEKLRLREDSNSDALETTADNSPNASNQDLLTGHITQYLNRYIVVGHGKELWIIDQHAAAERIRFEKLIDTYEDKKVESQSLLAPETLNLNEAEAAFVEENKKVLNDLGYEIEIDNSSIKLKSIPALMRGGDHKEIILEIFEELKEVEDFAEKDGILAGKYRDSVIATMACHSSVRMNRKLSQQETAGIFRDLMNCRNSYSCPHGRPIVWKLSQKEIEKNFER
jgi:DNA mismatch repair protein MutL